MTNTIEKMLSTSQKNLDKVLTKSQKKIYDVLNMANTRPKKKKKRKG